MDDAGAPGSGDYLPGASWGQVALIGVIVAALAFAIGWKVQEGGTPGVGSVEVGFLRDMVDHHDQAVQMSLLALRPGTGIDDRTSHFATEIVLQQRYEIGLMTAWLDDWGVGRGDVDREAMAWMVGPMATPVATMPGMATEEQLEALEAASGAEADGLFLELMIEHHRGGVHMAKEAERRADVERVAEFAGRVASVQEQEVAELRGLQRALGSTES